MKRIKILYRKNLKMTPGKLAAQCVHAALCLYGIRLVDMSVIVLGVSDKKFWEVERLPNISPPAYIQDLGYTELPEGTFTCVAFLARRRSTKGSRLTDPECPEK